MSACRSLDSAVNTPRSSSITKIVKPAVAILSQEPTKAAWALSRRSIRILTNGCSRVVANNSCVDHLGSSPRHNKWEHTSRRKRSYRHKDRCCRSKHTCRRNCRPTPPQLHRSPALQHPRPTQHDASFRLANQRNCRAIQDDDLCFPRGHRGRQHGHPDAPLHYQS